MAGLENITAPPLTHNVRTCARTYEHLDISHQICQNRATDRNIRQERQHISSAPLIEIRTSLHHQVVSDAPAKGTGNTLLSNPQEG